jgi:acyl-CoA synthetase (AMP-forming)/AMP-acid ligase II
MRRKVPDDSHRGTDGRNLWELVEWRASQTPDRELLADDAGRRMTFAELEAACERVAAALAARGVGAGTRVSWQLPTWLESVVLVGALARLGAVQNPMLPIYREHEMRFITEQFRPALFVTPSTWHGFDYEATARALAGDPARFEVMVCDRARALPEADPVTLPMFEAPPPGTVRWVFYTSGTTADPKGAQHTDQSVLAAALGAIEALDMVADDRSAVVFPLTHIGGILSIVESLVTGSSMVLIESFDPPTTIPLLAREATTLIGAGTPFFLAYLQAQRARPDARLFASARAFPAGGMPKPPEIHFEVKRELGGVGVISGYGMTECPVLSMNTIRDTDDKLATTEGLPTRGVDVRVIRLDGEPAAPGEEGELRVNGPMLFEGYLDASLDAPAFDEEGYLRTGDLGSRDPDGYLVITGRVKDVIIRKGENISAQEVESLLYVHEKVADVAVVGLADRDTGERCCAIVVPSDASDPPDLAELTQFLRDQGLMAQKLPEQLELLHTLPRNPTGKVLKHELRERFAAQPECCEPDEDSSRVSER